MPLQLQTRRALRHTQNPFRPYSRDISPLDMDGIDHRIHSKDSVVSLATLQLLPLPSVPIASVSI
jgi:hypothetical protein